MSYRLYIWALMTGLAAAFGAAYSYVANGIPLVGGSVGFAIGGILIAFELFIVQRPAGRRLRQLPLWLYISVSTLIWSIVIDLSLEIIPRLLFEFGYSPQYNKATYIDLAFSLVLSLLFNFAIRVRSLVGARVLRNFLLGRYHTPLREHHIFMFLDLADSMQLSETLGDIRAQSLIARFFFDIAQPISEHGGETHRYIGDEVVVTWPLHGTRKAHSCVQCVFDIQALVAANAEDYEREFGVAPRFRVGLHGGPVVASEIGDDKREIVYFGDTINTTARLCSACKPAGRDFLISGKLLATIELPAGARADSLGALEFAGKAKAMEVFALSYRRPEAAPNND